MGKNKFRRQQQPGQQPQQQQQSLSEEQQAELAVQRIQQYAAYKALALQGNPCYLVTLATHRGPIQVRGLDERKLDEIVLSWKSADTGLVSTAPMPVLAGIAQLNGYGAVVARPKDVLSISSFIDEGGTEDIDEEQDGDVEDTEDVDDSEDTLSHSMLNPE